MGNDNRTWTHEICDECWEKHQPGRKPRRFLNARAGDATPCCWCGTPNHSGIFVYHDPADVPCGGNGGPHAFGCWNDEPLTESA